jgi:hypothetical protein
LWVLLGAIGLVIAAAVVIPALGTGSGTDSSTTDPLALSDVVPFGRRLDGALAYFGEDRLFHLVDLGTGRSLGSKRVDADRRPVAATATRAFLGNFPILTESANWDTFRSSPWDDTAVLDHGSGLDLAYSSKLNIVAAAMRPLPSGQNGVMFTTETGSTEAIASDGLWAFATWAGDLLLARELTGDETRWWLLDPVGREPQGIGLPEDFVPIAGTDGYMLGAIGEEGFIADLETLELRRLTGGFSFAADWQHGERPQVATIGGDSPSLISYEVTGTFAWSVPLRDPVTRFGGGVSWSPDGSYVVTTNGGTLDAYTEQGGTIGTIDPSLPTPQPQMGFVTVVPSPLP